MSDGQPNDEWQVPLAAFIGDGRSAKCDRMAVAIGNDADEAVLQQFLQGTPHCVLHAAQAADIPSLFQRVTMSVTQRLHSKNPNTIPGVPKVAQTNTSTTQTNTSVNQTMDEPDDDEEAFF